MTGSSRPTVAAAALAMLAASCFAGCSSNKQVSLGTGPSSTAASGVPNTGTVRSASTTSTPPRASTPKTSPNLYLSGAINLPAGAPGEVSIIEVGTGSGSLVSIPFVVRNNTSDIVSDVKVSGTARSNGALVGSGGSSSIHPGVLNPGEWAFGEVFFETDIPVGATFDFTVSAQQGPSSFAHVDLKIAEVNRTRGDLGDAAVGIVSNETDRNVTGPVEVDLMCFQGSMPLAESAGGFTNGGTSETIAPGATSSFSVNLPDGPCPVFALGSAGFSF